MKCLRVAAACAVLMPSVGASADALPEVESAPPVVEDVVPEGASLSGRQIYQRVLDNRHRALSQRQRILSIGEDGAREKTELWLRWKDSRDEQGKPSDGVLSKTLAKYTDPRDVGYLIIQREVPPHDQFAYFPESRRTRRMNLGESIMGTDFSIEDIVPRAIEAAEYGRVADEIIDGESCYVIDLTPKPGSGSQYSKMRVHIEKQHFVPIYTRYWNPDGIETKAHRASLAAIEEIDGVWMVRESTMQNVIEGTSTVMFVEEIEPKKDIKESTFSVRNLERQKR